MNRFFNKRAGALAIMAMLSVNYLGTAVAQEIPSKENFRIPMVSVASVDESVVPYKNMGELNKMSYDEVIKYIVSLDEYKAHSDRKLKKQYNRTISQFSEAKDEVFEFFNDKNRVQAIVDEIVKRAAIYTPEDTKGIYSLIEALRLGYYVGFYNSELKYMKLMEMRELSIPAIRAVQANPNFKLGTKEQDMLVKNTALLVSASTCTSDIVNNFIPVLEDYYENIDEYLGGKNQKEKEFAAYNVLVGVRMAANNVVFFSNKELPRGEKITAEDTEFYGKIDKFIDLAGAYGLMDNYNDLRSALINNGLWVNGSLAKFHSDEDVCKKVHTDAMGMYERLSEPYLQSVSSLTYDMDGFDYYGNKIDKEGMKRELKNIYLPKKYSFDNGKFVVIAGDRVTEEKVQRLYWASKEVSAQFFRTYGRDEALEPGNADDVMTAVVYNDKDEYRLNNFINGYETNNGGIYIEKEGTFYTWERTRKESRYTLEELFRHEFTHYLQGRYVTPGLWGGEIFKKNRMTWFDEGGAEFFAGSTRTEGVVPRSSLITTNGSFAKNAEDRFSVERLLNFKSYTGELYAYSYTMRSFMISEKLDMLYDIAELVKDYDIEGYDKYLDKMKNDKTLNEEYQEYMKKLYEHRNEYTIPLVDDIYLEDHEEKRSEEMYTEIIAAAGLKDTKVEETRSQFFNAFTLRGTYTGEKSRGERADFNNMNAVADGFLKTLEGYEWSGYKTLTCYFTNHRTDVDGNVQYDVVFHGALTKEIENKPPIAVIGGPFAVITGKQTEFSSKGSMDQDGLIKSYLWDFGDGTVSNEDNPRHIYAEAGEYNISLTVEDSDGMRSTNVAKVKVDDHLSAENESNDKFEDANGPIYHLKKVKGVVEKGDNKDIFYFDATTSGAITLKVTADDVEDMSWNVYKAPNTRKHYSYANRHDNVLERTFDVEEGRYYLNVYTFSDNRNAYEIEIDGVVQGYVYNGIENLEDIEDINLGFGKELNLPRTVNATMTDGSVKEVEVIWSGSVDSKIPGEYDFVGSVNGTELRLELKVVVKRPGFGDYITEESEGNNKFELADGPIFEDIAVKGIVEKEDNKDRFFFDVIEEGEVTITLNSDKIDVMNWNVYGHDDLKNRIATPTRKDGVLTKTFSVKPGRYYLTVYKFAEEDCNYSFKINGVIQKNEINIESLEIFEDINLEVGGNFELPAVVKANMDNGDVQDMSVTWSGDINTEEAGVYEAIGIIEGTELVAKIKVIVEEPVQVDQYEPNNNIKKATGAIFDGMVIESVLGKGDSKDIFYFDIIGDEDVTISLESANSDKINWTLKKENQWDEYVAFGKRADGKLERTFKASPGRYYLDIYKFDDKVYDYKFSVTGGIQKQGVVTEKENEKNNNYKNANKVSFYTTMEGELMGNDSKDIFYFDADEAGLIDIMVISKNAGSMNWVMNKEGSEEHYAFAEKKSGALKRSVHVEAGRYYIHVYRTKAEDCRYLLNIKHNR